MEQRGLMIRFKREYIRGSCTHRGRPLTFSEKRFCACYVEYLRR